MIWKFIWVFFDTFTKVTICGQHPGRMSGVVFMSLLFYMFQINTKFFLFGKNQLFSRNFPRMGGGGEVKLNQGFSGLFLLFRVWWGGVATRMLTARSHLSEGVKKYPDEYPILFRICFKTCKSF